jgi:tRNA modification GTPase
VNQQESIVAIATASGPGAIAVIRISGKDCFDLVDLVFKGKKTVAEAKGNTILYGNIYEGEQLVDEVLVSVFRSPFSYTGEDVAEIACHGSQFIQQRILELLIQKGARMAGPGEFTMRAFLNGKKDLLQAEAVADLIAAENEASHQVALHQMRGGFSNDLAQLRDSLVHFAALIELELDFSQEDVEFADRDQLKQLVGNIRTGIGKLLASFRFGNAIKNGVPVAIAGEPNVGKSTLLNALLNEERAIVSDIAGTTRDTIEDEVVLEGIRFRFIDTAGIRKTVDTIELLGIERTFDKIRSAALVMVLVDLTRTSLDGLEALWASVNQEVRKEAELLLVFNKCDVVDKDVLEKYTKQFPEALVISAKSGTGLDALVHEMVTKVGNKPAKGSTIVTNVRHFDSLFKADQALAEVLNGIEAGISNDFVAIDIRKALFHLGEITGTVSTDELLGNIFGRFCIGK